MQSTQLPRADDLLRAHARIKPFIHRTPVLTCTSIDRAIDDSCRVFFKCENLQKIGAFKIRGATNTTLCLSPQDAQKGVCTHSSGNHGQGLALAAKNCGVPAYIVMPSNSSSVKLAAVKGYGAKVILCKPTLQDRETTLQQVVAQTGATFVHPYDNFDVIIGQSTAAIELMEQAREMLSADSSGRALDLVLAPVGGGGLLAGTALAVHYFGGGAKVIAVEPQGADDAYRSFRAGRIIPQTNPQTVADGLRTSVGERNFSIMRRYVSDVVTVSEQGIVEAMKLVMERMKIVIEPSSAVPLAALLEKKIDVRGQRVGIIISGGNVDLNQLPWMAAKL
jgi:threonine dehydratase